MGTSRVLISKVFSFSTLFRKVFITKEKAPVNRRGFLLLFFHYRYVSGTNMPLFITKHLVCYVLAGGLFHRFGGLTGISMGKGERASSVWMLLSLLIFYSII